MLLQNRLINKGLHLKKLLFLINASGTDLADEIKEGARELKQRYMATGLSFSHLSMSETDVPITANIADSEPPIQTLSVKHLMIVNWLKRSKLLKTTVRKGLSLFMASTPIIHRNILRIL